VSWSSNDGWKDGSWSIISSKSSLTHSRSIINNKCLNFVTFLE
jgi:hypothetical protein